MHNMTTVERPGTGWLARATIAGFIALGVTAVTMVIVSGVAGAMGEAFRDSGLLFQWMYDLTHNPVAELGQGQLFKALALHLSFGLVLAVLYALVFEPRLRAYPGWQAGIIFAMLPFFLSVVVFLPLAGGGLFGSELGAGPLPVLGNLILHLMYGAILGTGYASGLDRTEAAADEVEAVEQSATMHRSERSAARGILLGVVLGGVIGVVLGRVLPFGAAEALFGNWPVAMGVAGGLAGGAMGALIGSMAGLTEPEAAIFDEPPSTGEPISALLLPLGVIATVATLIVSIGSLLLTVAGPLHEPGHYYYGMPIAVGVTILILVIVVAAIVARSGHGSSGVRPH